MATTVFWKTHFLLSPPSVRSLMASNQLRVSKSYQDQIIQRFITFIFIGIPTQLTFCMQVQWSMNDNAITKMLCQSWSQKVGLNFVPSFVCCWHPHPLSKLYQSKRILSDPRKGHESCPRINDFCVFRFCEGSWVACQTLPWQPAPSKQWEYVIFIKILRATFLAKCHIAE